MGGVLPVTTYYRPPEGSVPVLLRNDRRGRPSRFHQGVRWDGRLLTPEACNLVGGESLVELPADQVGLDGYPVGDVAVASLCRRCFPRKD